MANKQRNVVVDLFKGLAILTTLYGHAALVIGVLDLPLHSKISIIGQIELLASIPLFFFLSGYTTTSDLLYVKNLFLRLFKLYIPYAIAILFLIFILYFYQNSVPSFVFKYFLLQGRELPSYFEMVPSSMWFFPNFFLVCLTTPFLLRLSKNHNLSLFFLLLLIIVNCLFSFNDTQVGQVIIYSIINLHFFFFYLFFYFLGIYIKNRTISGREFCFMTLALLPIALYTLKLFDFRSLHILMFPPKIPFLLVSLFSILLFLYFQNYENKFRLLLSKSYFLKFLNYTGKNVFIIYLYQGFICSALYESIIKQPTTSNPYILLFFSFIVILLGTYPLVLIFNKINALTLKMIFKVSLSIYQKLKTNIVTST